MKHLLLLLSALALAEPAHAVENPDPAAPAIDNVPRIWRALSGDRMELDGKEVQLRGVTCPGPDTDAGRAAKALLNTFLRDGRIECRVFETETGDEAVCSKEGRDFATGLQQSGLCKVDLSHLGNHALPSVGGADPGHAVATPTEIRQLSVHKRIRCLELELVDGTELDLCLPHQEMGEQGAMDD